MILLGAKEITGADGGTLYTVTEDHHLKFEIMRTDSLGIALGGTTGKEIPSRHCRSMAKTAPPTTAWWPHTVCCMTAR